MKTATAEDLLTRLPTILAWLDEGEEVVLESRPRQPAEASTRDDQTTVDWSKSAVFKRPLSNPPLLSQADLDELFEDVRGPY
jgi:hypothetical protein